MNVEIGIFDWSLAETAAFAARLKAADRAEFLGTTGIAGAAAVAEAIRRDISATAQRGGIAFGARIDGVPCAVFAAAPDSITADSASIWMLSTRECEAHPVIFARRSRLCFRTLCDMLPGVETFWNWTQDTGCHRTTRQWLEWLGAWFSVSEYWKSPWTGERFVKFGLPAERRAACQ